MASIPPLTGTSQETANVYLRIRPVDLDASLWKFHIEMRNTFVAANIENSQTKHKNTVEEYYKFRHVFDEFSPQMDIYNTCVRPLISLEHHATIMVYGTSGSGKTHTLLGDSDNPGLVPRALSQLFIEYGNNMKSHPTCKLQNGAPCVIPDGHIYQEEKIRFELLNSMTDSQSVEQMFDKLKIENKFEGKFIESDEMFVWVSFVEIYNEEVYDLLAPSVINCTKRKTLKVMSNNGQPFVQGVTQVFVRSFKEAIKILQYGIGRVTTGSTTINERSSRSHCIYFVDVIKWNPLTSMTSVSYKFCDLAGSERLKKTENVGERLKEAKNINKSLMTLGRCLVIANGRQKNKSAIIPYRDSKLTTLMQNALLGHEKISLIVNLNPRLDYIEENLNVLSFASIAKEIRIKPKEIVSSTVVPSTSTSQAANSSIITIKKQIDKTLNQNLLLDNNISKLHREVVEHQTELRTSIIAAVDQDYRHIINHLKRKIVELKKDLKQKDKCLEHKEKLIIRYRATHDNYINRADNLELCIQERDELNKNLQAQIKRLKSSHDDSETELTD